MPTPFKCDKVSPLCSNSALLDFNRGIQVSRINFTFLKSTLMPQSRAMKQKNLLNKSLLSPKLTRVFFDLSLSLVLSLLFQNPLRVDTGKKHTTKHYRTTHYGVKVTQRTRCKEYAWNDTRRSIARHRLNRATTGKRTLKRHLVSPLTSLPIHT